MKSSPSPEKKFSLKDILFSLEKVTYLADLLKKSYPKLRKKNFIKEVIERFPELELKERVTHIARTIQKHLPQKYPRALEIVLSALPPELDPKKTDNDFGQFIIAPFGEFVAEFGCDKDNYSLSMDALFEITKRFSVEKAIRSFINNFPKETLKAFLKLTTSKNYHQRRLASEGSRMTLPWAPKISWQPQQILAILDKLYYDKTRYVTRSVANSLNDISKVDAQLTIATLKRWKKTKKQTPKEMDFIIRHALRTLLKRGNKDALKMIGLSSAKHVKIKNVKCAQEILMGENLEFSFELETQNNKLGNLRIEYAVYYLRSNGKYNPKIFKLRESSFNEAKVFIAKRHSFRIISTRKYYEGKHYLAIIINGEEVKKLTFDLRIST